MTTYKIYIDNKRKAQSDLSNYVLNYYYITQIDEIYEAQDLSYEKEVKIKNWLGCTRYFASKWSAENWIEAQNLKNKPDECVSDY
jgi:hypothetical protein